jgi:PBSX family phage terminase large subunit
MNQIILHKGQKEIANDLHRFRVVNCGRRFGKTTLAVVEMIGKAVYGKDRNICYIAPTYQQARDIAWQQLKNLAQPVINTVNESRLELIINTADLGTSRIYLRGWEALETLRGMRFDMLVLDEVASYRNFLSGWHEVLRPTLTDTKGDALFISTPKGFNHFYELYNNEAKDKDYRSFHFTSYDNPFLPKEELDKAKQELTEDRFAQEYGADFRKTEGLVYKMFDRSKHLYKDLVFDKTSYFAGVDFGFNNPAAVLHIYKDSDNKFYVNKEWYKDHKTDDEIAEYISTQGFNYVYPDPEAAAAIEAIRRKGVNIREVNKGKDSIKNGISTVSELFKQNRLFIHESCENLIYELETYSYPEKKDMRNEDENPIKENDHALDALRYALSMQISTNQQPQHFYPKTFHYNQLDISHQGDTPITYYPNARR